MFINLKVEVHLPMFTYERKKEVYFLNNSGAYLMFIIIRAVQPIYIHIADKTSRTMYQNGLELRGTAGIGRKHP